MRSANQGITLTANPIGTLLKHQEKQRIRTRGRFRKPYIPYPEIVTAEKATA